MQKHLVLVTVASTALLSGVANAAELHVLNPVAPMVRIAVAGKSADQLKAEIQSAAETVCGAADTACVQDSIDDANRQLASLQRAKADFGPVEVSKEGPLTARVALAGKSRAQVLVDIKAAARAVCQPAASNAAEFRDCVDTAVSNAQYQLRHMTLASAGAEQLALN